MEKIYHHFDIKVPVPQVFRSITTVDGLKSWWTTDVTGDPVQKGELRFGFGDMFNKMKVIAVEKDKSVEWKCIEGPPDWIGTTIIFRLSPHKGNSTVIDFTHEGWKEMNEFYGICNHHWGLFMKSMKDVYEKGKGSPAGA